VSMHHVRGHYRKGRWVRSHYRKNPAGRAVGRAGRRRADGTVAVLVAVGIALRVAARALEWMAAHWWIIAVAIAIPSGCWAVVRFRARADLLDRQTASRSARNIDLERDPKIDRSGVSGGDESEPPVANEVA
jgi:hypothetical protein